MFSCHRPGPSSRVREFTSTVPRNLGDAVDMTEDLQKQIAELNDVHKELTHIVEYDAETLLSGAVGFEASADDGLETITDSFDIELTIPHIFPDRLCGRRRSVAGSEPITNISTRMARCASVYRLSSDACFLSSRLSSGSSISC